MWLTAHHWRHQFKKSTELFPITSRSTWAFAWIYIFTDRFGCFSEELWHYGIPTKKKLIDWTNRSCELFHTEKKNKLWKICWLIFEILCIIHSPVCFILFSFLLFVAIPNDMNRMCFWDHLIHFSGCDLNLNRENASVVHLNCHFWMSHDLAVPTKNTNPILF